MTQLNNLALLGGSPFSLGAPETDWHARVYGSFRKVF